MPFAAQAENAAGGSGAPSVAPAGDGDLAGPGGTDLYLELTLNGNPRGLVHFGLRGKELWASAATLRQLGFVLPAGTADPVRLNSLPGVQASYDAAGQSVAINASADVLRLPMTVVDTSTVTAQEASTSRGVVLNYDLYGTQGRNNTSSLNALTELRAFSGSAVLSNTMMSRAARLPGEVWRHDSVRLDTTWSKSFPDDMLTLRVGDTTTASLPWSRSTRIGGIQLSRNFALQPYRSTTPLPAFLGSATLPSQVELYINGLRQYSGQVPAGPFQLKTVPSINGAGNAQVVLTDAFGRATTLDFSLYDTQRLLQEGLSDWSVDLGMVRKDYGLRSFEYGSEPAASGTWRYGLSNSFTLEAHGEATHGLVKGGIGGAWLLGQGGVLSGAVAHSSYGKEQGSLMNLGYSWRDNQFNFAVEGTRTRGEYRDVASLYGGPPPRGSGRASIGYTTDDLGSFGLSYLYLRYPTQQATRLASVYWFKSFGRSASVNVSLNQNLDDRRERSLFVGFTWVLDGNVTASAGLQREGNRNVYTADAQSSTPGEGGFGWRAGLRQGGGQNGGQAEIDYLGRYGRAMAGISVLGDTRYAYAGATGSIVFMGGQPFAARRIDDAFAVVSTDGIAGVPVRLENRDIGTTDGNGMLLVAPLRAYQNNQLSIDPMQLPADVRIERVKTVATPSDRAGTLVRFGITPISAAALILVDEAGKPLPLGSRVSANGGEPALVGFDGAVYLETLQPRNTLEVQTPAGGCRASFDYRKDGAGIPQIGPLRCTREAKAP
ncbi:MULTISPECIES: fimbria/pilus outer membrane usher protein [Variovorax]|uniref:fimbria/pilus outer membrane usher protein n=1 Tax=Variovorax TaxID=34072 RepID=UPI00285DBD10|nr:fimbria/pilus outer membrane usher protein [Variovorax sp. 3319]MDR6889822.1 outer membrane usher protein [Variovorax sp. 3319]